MGQLGGLDNISPRILNPYYSIGVLNAFSFFFFFKTGSILTPDTRKTTSNLLTTHLKGHIIYKPMVKLSGKSRNILKLFNTCILKIWMVSHKTIHMAFVNEKKIVKFIIKFLR